MKAKTLFIRIVFAVLSLILIAYPIANYALALDDYYHNLNVSYHFGSNPYYCEDYARDNVNEYGGWDEGEPIPTDFTANTFVEGIFVHKHYKMAEVEADFYDPGYVWVGYGTDTAWVAYSHDDIHKDSAFATVYGDGLVNEEYGLYDVYSQHRIYCRAWDGLHWVEWQLTQSIYIDTAELYK